MFNRADLKFRFLCKAIKNKDFNHTHAGIKRGLLEILILLKHKVQQYLFSHVIACEFLVQVYCKNGN